jgi:hypothetical protein
LSAGTVFEECGIGLRLSFLMSDGRAGSAVRWFMLLSRILIYLNIVLYILEGIVRRGEAGCQEPRFSSSR